jgi:5'-nucleotidase
MNPGGLRADLVVPTGGGTVTYGQIFSVQPFGNNLVVKSMSGALLGALLEQQFNSGTNTVDSPRVLFPSNGFSYDVDLGAPAGQRVSNMRLNGVPLDPAAQYRVTMNSFLADGGDNFSAFRQGTAPLGGPLDVDALEAYLGRGAPVVAPPTDRIHRR